MGVVGKVQVSHREVCPVFDGDRLGVGLVARCDECGRLKIQTGERIEWWQELDAYQLRGLGFSWRRVARELTRYGRIDVVNMLLAYWWWWVALVVLAVVWVVGALVSGGGA